MFNTEYITQLLLGAVAVLITLTVHEYAHGYAAYKLGDSTAKSYGRLSLNPLKHLDPFGAVCMLFFHFGWAKPVPINPRNFNRPRRDFAITAAAGPLSNIVMGFFTAPLFLLFANLFRYSEIPLLNSIMTNTLLFVYTFFRINIGLGIFNLLPIPPFDGSRIVNVLLPPKAYFGIMKYERFIYWGVVAWLLLGQNVYSFLVSIPFIGASPVLSGVASVFALSMHISSLVDLIAEGMLAVWGLIPFLHLTF